jgi:hypothetical protein
MVLLDIYRGTFDVNNGRHMATVNEDIAVLKRQHLVGVFSENVLACTTYGDRYVLNILG